MKLSLVIFYSLRSLNHISCKLLENLTLMDIRYYWNPSPADVISLNPKETLVVSDTLEGISFAEHHHLPYIQLWDETSVPSQTARPVCYYDRIESLSCAYLENQWRRANHLPITVAKNSRLNLTELTLDDYRILYKILKDETIAPKLPPLDSLEIQLEKHQQYITYQYEFFDYGLWGIFRKNGELIGQAGIQNYEYHGKTMLELSYVIAPAHQRKGYATEAILAIYEYIITNLEQNQVLAIIAKNNQASIKTAMNLGMKRHEEVEHLGFCCNYYILGNIKDFLVCYEKEQKRTIAAKSALRSALKKPVQEVYTKYRT